MVQGKNMLSQIFLIFLFECYLVVKCVYYMTLNEKGEKLRVPMLLVIKEILYMGINLVYTLLKTHS